MADARIVRVALVVVAQAFYGTAEIDPVMIAILGLYLLYLVAAFGHLVRMLGFGTAVTRVDFCP